MAAVMAADNWWCIRAAGSHGVADLICLKDGHKPMMLEIKSNSGSPFANFGPAKRQALLVAARQSGANCFLVNWAKNKDPVWIPPGDWPKPRRSSGSQ